MQHTVVLGGGAGGVVAATLVKRALRKKMQVTVIEKEPRATYCPSYPLVMVGQRKPEEVVLEYNNLTKHGVELVRATANGLDLRNHEVATTQGSINYDFLVIALGVEYHPESVPGFSQFAFNTYFLNDVIKVRNRLAEFGSGRIVIFVSSLPFKCPAAPYEMAFLTSRYFQQKGNRDKVKITLVTPEPTPEALAPPAVGKSVRDALAEQNIELLTEAKVLKLEEGELICDHGLTVVGDLFLGVPPHWGPALLRDTDIVDAAGWVEVNLATLETSYPGVYAIGDNAAIRVPTIGIYAPKAAVFAHNQAKVAADAIIKLARGQKPSRQYLGRGSCTMDVGDQLARHSNIDYYHEPAPRVILQPPTEGAYAKKVTVAKEWTERWV